MATRIGPQSYTFRDAKGFPWTLKHHISYSDATDAEVNNARKVANAINLALQGLGAGTLPLTNGAIQKTTGPLATDSIPFAYGVAAQYLNCEDKLVVGFYDTGGAIHRFGIGAPVVAAFLADQETGKGSQLVDFVAAMTTPIGAAFACTKGGVAFASATGSVLVRRTQRRKVTLSSKSANLDEPGE